MCARTHTHTHTHTHMYSFNKPYLLTFFLPIIIIIIIVWLVDCGLVRCWTLPFLYTSVLMA